MTGMLASVSSVAEARIALREGADIIDLKDPAAGALGALDPKTLAAIAREIKGAAPVSATAGDIGPDDPALFGTICRIAETGVDIVKVGLFAGAPGACFIEAIDRAIEAGIRPVIVLFAEDYTGAAGLRELLNLNIAGLMLDTKNKSGRGLTQIQGLDALAEFVETAGQHRLLSGLAGSLRYSDIESLAALAPDYLGFRGALCAAEDRRNPLDGKRVKKIREAVARFAMIDADNTNTEKEELRHGTVA